MALRENQTQLDDVRLVFKNFAGKADRYNAAGKRNFAIVLDAAEAQRLSELGFNVKTRPPREEGDEPFNFLKVNLNMAGDAAQSGNVIQRGAQVNYINSTGRTLLDRDTVFMVDTAQIARVDLIIRQFKWDPNEPPAAYLDMAFITIDETELEKRYADIKFAIGDEADGPSFVPENPAY